MLRRDFLRFIGISGAAAATPLTASKLLAHTDADEPLTGITITDGEEIPGAGDFAIKVDSERISQEDLNNVLASHIRNFQVRMGLKPGEILINFLKGDECIASIKADEGNFTYQRNWNPYERGSLELYHEEPTTFELDVIVGWTQGDMADVFKEDMFGMEIFMDDRVIRCKEVWWTSNTIHQHNSILSISGQICEMTHGTG